VLVLLVYREVAEGGGNVEKGVAEVGVDEFAPDDDGLDELDDDGPLLLRFVVNCGGGSFMAGGGATCLPL